MGCSGLAGLGKEPPVADGLVGRQQCCALPLRRGEGGVVQSLGDKKGVAAHPEGHCFWVGAWAGLNWNRMSVSFC